MGLKLEFAFLLALWLIFMGSTIQMLLG